MSNPLVLPPVVVTAPRPSRPWEDMGMRIGEYIFGPGYGQDILGPDADFHLADGNGMPNSMQDLHESLDISLVDIDGDGVPDAFAIFGQGIWDADESGGWSDGDTRLSAFEGIEISNTFYSYSDFVSFVNEHYIPDLFA